VIGGGFTGVNTAIELAQRGLSVILLEARRIGWGASGRNGGQLIRGIGHDVSGLPGTSARTACAIWSRPVSTRWRWWASASRAWHRLRPALGLLRTGQHPGAVRGLQGRTGAPGLGYRHETRLVGPGRSSRWWLEVYAGGLVDMGSGICTR
jgi:glycine/D-amino acid oxidase-like deaminating enzyme